MPSCVPPTIVSCVFSYLLIPQCSVFPFFFPRVSPWLPTLPCRPAPPCPSCPPLEFKQMLCVGRAVGHSHPAHLQARGLRLLHPASATGCRGTASERQRPRAEAMNGARGRVDPVIRAGGSAAACLGSGCMGIARFCERSAPGKCRVTLGRYRADDNTGRHRTCYV